MPFEFLSVAAGATRCGDSVGWRCYAKGTTQDVRLLTKRGTTLEVCSLGHGAVQHQQWKCSHLAGARQIIWTGRRRHNKHRCAVLLMPQYTYAMYIYVCVCVWVWGVLNRWGFLACNYCINQAFYSLVRGGTSNRSDMWQIICLGHWGNSWQVTNFTVERK